MALVKFCCLIESRLEFLILGCDNYVIIQRIEPSCAEQYVSATIV